MNKLQALQPVLDFIEGKHADQKQARTVLREFLFKRSLGPDEEELPAIRLLVSLLVNGIKPILTLDARQNEHLERLVRRLKRGLAEAEQEAMLEELRVVSQWLREAMFPAKAAVAAVETPAIAEVVSPPPVVGISPDFVNRTLPRLLQGLMSFSEGEENLIAEGRRFLEEMALTQGRFWEDIAGYSAKVVTQAQSRRQAWESERVAFLDLVAELAFLLKEVGRGTSGMDEQLGRTIGRLQGSATIEDLQTLRAVLMSEAHALKNQTESVNRQLAETQTRLHETRQRLESMEEELDKTRRESMTDPLTRVANRRALDQILEREVARGNRYRLAMAMVLIDLDHFKKVNDTYGHPVGDKVLSTVADRMSKLLRKCDFLARFGGEEFAILLPETTVEDAITTAEKLRQEVASLRFRTTSRVLQVTASFGICGLGPDTDTIEEFIKGADEALYQAKAQGRNRVVAAPVPVWDG
ncbi:MAG: diguanylate cyclase [Magnetococcales bacterium]|nr:diguanylate cyclase [Magnetococcales bacterium]